MSETVGGLEHELEAMLEIEKFPPPAEFREQASWADPAIYEEAAADPVAWWTARSKELLDWDVEPTQGLDDSNPPFYKWFEDGRINASAQCLDRHVAAGIGDRVAYHWRGEEGERRDVTYAELYESTQRFANALKDLGVGQGRRGRDLPADDPRGRGGDAGLRPDRRDPQRRLRRLLGRVGPRADGIRRGQGAGHRRRRPAQGQDRADQGAGRRGDGRAGEPREDRRHPRHRDRLPDDRGPRRLLRRGLRGGRPGVPGGADGGRAPALHPLHRAARPRSRRGSSTPPAATSPARRRPTGTSST